MVPENLTANCITVGELIDDFSEYDPSDIVILQEDAEGNGHSPLAGSDEARYVAASTWSGDVYCPWPLSAEDLADGFAREDARMIGEDGAVRCVVLYPVN